MAVQLRRSRSQIENTLKLAQTTLKNVKLLGQPLNLDSKPER